MTTWANRTKAAAKAVPLTKKKYNTTRREGIFEALKPRTYSTGSFGVDLKYTVNGFDKAVYETIVLIKADGSATPYGEATLKKRLMAIGLSSKEINALTMPVKLESDAAGALVEAAVPGAGVALFTEDEQYMGKPKLRVKSVFPLDRE